MSQQVSPAPRLAVGSPAAQQRTSLQDLEALEALLQAHLLPQLGFAQLEALRQTCRALRRRAILRVWPFGPQRLQLRVGALAGW